MKPGLAREMAVNARVGAVAPRAYAHLLVEVVERPPTAPAPGLLLLWGAQRAQGLLKSLPCGTAGAQAGMLRYTLPISRAARDGEPRVPTAVSSTAASTSGLKSTVRALFGPAQSPSSGRRPPMYRPSVQVILTQRPGTSKR
jgi:hypothetical protein